MQALAAPLLAALLAGCAALAAPDADPNAVRQLSLKQFESFVRTTYKATAVQPPSTRRAAGLVYQTGRDANGVATENELCEHLFFGVGNQTQAFADVSERVEVNAGTRLELLPPTLRAYFARPGGDPAAVARGSRLEAASITLSLSGVEAVSIPFANERSKFLDPACTSYLQANNLLGSRVENVFIITRSVGVRDFFYDVKLTSRSAAGVEAWATLVGASGRWEASRLDQRTVRVRPGREGERYTIGLNVDRVQKVYTSSDGNVAAATTPVPPAAVKSVARERPAGQPGS